ncbi:uncharacterized protein TNCV_1592121 [Trichonephila clavipes]|nr:uncharacterized protein TNCV_1592121 [Trichonephila clavipes]
MIAASPLSPDEYAMRIATQTESVSSSVKSTRPHSLYLQFQCSRHHRERLLRWAGVKGTHRTGRRANRPPPCSLLATVKRDIGRPVACVVYLAISPCCLPPVSSGLWGRQSLRLATVIFISVSCCLQEKRISGSAFTPPKRVTRFPTPEEAQRTHKYTHGLGCFGEIPAFWGVIDREEDIPPLTPVQSEKLIASFGKRILSRNTASKPPREYKAHKNARRIGDTLSDTNFLSPHFGLTTLFTNTEIADSLEWRHQDSSLAETPNLQS